jgi:pimeloyl-ACP methyl ester carboxylesterase
MKKGLIIIIRSSLLVYVGLVATLYLMQESLLFLPQTTASDFKYRYDAQEVFLPVTNATLHGLYFKNENPEGLILYFHGNAGSLQDWGSVCEPLVALNFNCLIFDYRGYGKSTDKIKNQTQWFNDAEAMFEYAQTSSSLPLILYGRSVGTSMASYLAGKHIVDRVILETAPYAFTEVAQTLYPHVPVKWLLKYKFKNAQHLLTNKNPTLLIHGTQDEAIPYAQFQKLATTFPNYQTLSIEGGMHNDLSRFEEYWFGLEAFLVR